MMDLNLFLDISSGACIYLHRASSNSLVPKTSMGRLKYSSVQEIALDDSKSQHSPVSAAFKKNKIIMGEHVVSGSGIATFTAGVLGECKKRGVLYLELSDVARQSTENERRIGFQLMRQALHDCLRLALDDL